MLKTNDLQSLKEHFEVKNFRKGEVIFPQGQIANGAYVVIKGLVHLKKIGIVQKIGISIYNMEELNSILPKYKIDLGEIYLINYARKFIN